MGDKTKLNKFIRNSLEELFPEHKFKSSFQEFYPEHFGNEIIEFEFENFLMTVTKDRSQLFIDLTSKKFPDKRIWLPQILESIDLSGITEFTEHNFQSIKRQLELLSKNLFDVLAHLDRISEIK